MALNNILSAIFGNKAQRDLKEINPYVQKILAAYPEVRKLSNDELRARSQKLMDYVDGKVAKEKAKIEELKSTIEDLELEDREKVWNEVDKIEKDILAQHEKTLEEILPEVFSIMKDTARRFTENEFTEVTATEFDRQLAVKHDFVHIEGDKAIYQNHWMAGGNEITWDMIHYDVQLFGGVVLHKGKIAEMATGEGKPLWLHFPFSSMP